MKKLALVLVMIFVVMAGHTQTFEGVMHLKMKLDVTDPKLKAEMAKANDPANQAKMKELQDKMKDPQFKALMDQNPQMKAQMEAAMKAMAAGGGLAAMMPTGMTVKLKGLNSLMSIEGGMMDKNDMLHLGDKNITYTINNASKTYMVMSKGSSPATSERKPKITKTSETATIIGYKCTKYIIEEPTLDGKNVTINYWATTDITGLDLKALAKLASSYGQSIIYPEIEGAPLKTETSLPQGVMTTEVTELKKETFPSSTFEIPSGYTEAKF